MMLKLQFDVLLLLGWVGASKTFTAYVATSGILVTTAADYMFRGSTGMIWIAVSVLKGQCVKCMRL